MDEKTESLRDIFMDVSDEETVTERQDKQRGSLLDEGDVHERLADVIEAMQDRYGFDTDLSTDQRCRLVAAVYDDEDDAAIAEDLGVSRSTVQRARLELHLFRDRDTDAPFDLSELSAALEEDHTTGDLAERFDVSESTIRRYRRVLRARERSRAANQRYVDQFEEILTDAGLSSRMTERVRQDGLDDATEGMETDVSF